MQTIYLENRDPRSVRKRWWLIGSLYVLIIATLFWNLQGIANSFFPSVDLPRLFSGTYETFSSVLLGLTLGGMFLLFIYWLAPHQLGLQICYVRYGTDAICWQLPGMKKPIRLEPETVRSCRSYPDKLTLDTEAGPMDITFNHLSYNDIQALKKAFSVSSGQEKGRRLALDVPDYDVQAGN